MASTVVTNFIDLKNAAQDPNIDTVYVNADITLESGGILLSKNKPGLVIDCLYPQDGSGTIHSITDRNNNAQSDTIRVELSSASYHLTLRNCIAYGRNYYGIINCVNGSAQSGTTLTLENVEYSGPQAAYNRYGTVEVKGGSYRIGAYNGTSSAIHETVEANIVLFSGTVDVVHEGSANSCFYMSQSNPRFVLEENARLTIETLNREIIYCDTSVDFTMEAGSYFYAKTPRALLYSSGMYARNFSVGENAEFIFDQQARHTGVGTIQCNGNFSAAAGSRIFLVRTFSASEPLISFHTTATATFTDPDTVVLYNAAGRVIHWAAGTGTLNITADNINYWTVAADLSIAGTFDDPPLYNWFKADNSIALIGATLNSSTTTAVSTNLLQDVDAQDIPTTTTFNVQNARVLSFGRLPLTLNEIHDYDATISGTAPEGAVVRYGSPSDYHYTTADENDAYSFYLPSPVHKFDIYTISSNIEFKFKSMTAESEGSILFWALPERLPFRAVALPVRRAVVPRINSDWEIVIRDSRENGGSWSLYANAPLPLSTGSATLDNALVFTENGSTSSIEGASSVKIYTGTGNTAEFTDTIISWDEIEGLLLNLIVQYPYAAGHYETPIVFTVVEEDQP